MLKNLLNKKRYIYLLILSGTLILTGCQNNTVEKMNLRNNSFVIEYGKAISVNAEDYLNNSQEFLKDVKIINIPENDQDKKYPPVGNYEISLKHDDQEEKVKIVVQDTIAPVFKNIKEKYTVNVGSKLNIKEIKAEDLSTVTVSCDDSNVNYKKAGTYKAKVIAMDQSKNKVEKMISIIVNVENKVDKVNKKANSQTILKSSPSSSEKNSTSDHSSVETPKKSLIETLKVSKKYSKVFIVSSKSYSARQGTFAYYHKVNGNWKKEFQTTADLGKAGIGTGSENSTKTPIGQYTFTKLFGVASNPGTIMNYHKVDNNDYWCGETYYNQFIDEDNHEHNCSKKNDEHLIRYSNAYKYAAAFNYNSGNVKGKGFAFFLHCSSSPRYTGGCIAIGTSYMKKVIQQIDRNTIMIVDLEKNISHY